MVTSGHPRNQPVDEQPEVGTFDRVFRIAQIQHQILGQLSLHAHVRLRHLRDVAVDVDRLLVRHPGARRCSTVCVLCLKLRVPDPFVLWVDGLLLYRLSLR